MLHHGTRYAAVVGRTADDWTAPTLRTATVAADGTTVALVFHEAVVAASWADLITLTGSTTPTQFLQYASGDGSTTVVFDAIDPIPSGETVTLDYTGPGVTDRAGNALANIVGFSVTNNSAV